MSVSVHRYYIYIINDYSYFNLQSVLNSVFSYCLGLLIGKKNALNKIYRYLQIFFRLSRSFFFTMLAIVGLGVGGIRPLDICDHRFIRVEIKCI
jgi:hypothetical protein